MDLSTPAPAYVELSFRPNAELVSVVRRFVSTFYVGIFSDDDATARVALATHELLENAVRYSIDGETTVRIEVTRKPGLKKVLIRTWNRTEKSHIAFLEKLFSEMKQDMDPFDYYQLLMRRNAKRLSGSGLGLARIRAEAEMELTFEVVDGRVCMLAETMVHVREPA